MPHVNIWAVIVGGVLGFFSGGLWYSKNLFGGVWNREAGRPEKCDEKGSHPAQIFAVGIALSIAAAYFLAVFLGPEPGLHLALHHSFVVGLVFVAGSFGINYGFASRSLKLWLIDGGYHTLQFTIIGLVLGLWH